MTKTEIVDTAFRVWGRNFYRKTSLSQLAEELGVSKPALYRHFVSKKALNTAMIERFLDDFASSIREDFNKASETSDTDKGIFTIINSIAGYFARNVYALIFSLMNIYERNMDGYVMAEHLKSRGVDMGILLLIIKKKYAADTEIVQLIFASLIFYMSHFHITGKTLEKQPSAEEIQKNINDICEVINHGLGFSPSALLELNFEKQEKKIEETLRVPEPEPLFKVVAEAVAETGPWETSMDMVAKRLGLSKSSLYGHFKNKKDMLKRLFMGEFSRIIEFARQGIKSSSNPVEQLYLGIYSITVYLHSRPEILVAMDRIRTRKLDMGKPKKEINLIHLFEDIDIEPIKTGGEEEKQRISNWILFLLINILMRSFFTKDINSEFSCQKVQNNDIRVLFKFVTLGLGGFIR